MKTVEVKEQPVDTLNAKSNEVKLFFLENNSIKMFSSVNYIFCSNLKLCIKNST